MDKHAALSLIAWGWFALLAVAGQVRMQTGAASDALGSGRVVTNIALGAMDLAIGLAWPLGLVVVAAIAGHGEFGLLRWIGLGGWAGFAASLALADFANWSVHVVSHRWTWLWRLHRVHHCDTSLDVLTTYRHHPFESVAGALLQAAIVALLGLDPAGVAAYALVLTFLAPLLHANVAWPVPAPLVRATRTLLMTPALHALHHSAWRIETDSNYGQFLSIWDRLAGTWRGHPEAGPDRRELGLGARYRAGASRLGAQLALPFAAVEPPGEGSAASMTTGKPLGQDAGSA